MKAKVFISYSSEDINKLNALKNALKKRDNIEPVIIADRRSPGNPLASKVKEGMDEANCLMPILTRKSISNQWVNQEIGYAECKKSITIIPIVEEGITHRLKGFIHKQLDLPFVFKGNAKNARKEGQSFRIAYNAALEYIEKSSKMEPKSISEKSIPKITSPRRKYVKDEYLNVAGSYAKPGSAVIVITSLDGKYFVPQGTAIADSEGKWEVSKCHLLHKDRDRLIYAIAIDPKNEGLVRELFKDPSLKAGLNVKNLFEKLMKERGIQYKISDGKRLIRKS